MSNSAFMGFSGPGQGYCPRWVCAFAEFSGSGSVQHPSFFVPVLPCAPRRIFLWIKFTAEAVQMSIINLGFCKKNLIITGF